MRFRWLLSLTLILLGATPLCALSDTGGAGFVDFSGMTESDLNDAIRSAQTELATANNGTRRFQLQRRTADLELELATRVDQPYEHARRALTIYNQQLSYRTFPAQESELLYRSAYAAELAGDFSAGIVALTRLIHNYPDAALVPEAYFRRAEMRFVTGSYAAAEQDYSYIVPLEFSSPFYMESLYKRGWARYRQRNYRGSLEDQAQVMAVLLGIDALKESGDINYSQLSPAQRSIAQDAVRNVVLDLAALGPGYSLQRFTSDFGLAAYDYALTQRLIRFWRDRGRGDIAAWQANRFLARSPDHPAAGRLRMETVAALEDAGRIDEALPIKQAFVTRYGLDGGDWQGQPAMDVPEQRQRIETFARDITRTLHARAQRSGSGHSEAADWYSKYLSLFPESDYALEVPLLLGDLLTETGQFSAAAQAYERAAYGDRSNPKAAEAGLASVLAWRKAAGQSVASDPQVEAASLRFAEAFPYHPEAPAVLANLAETRYDAGDLQGADRLARQILAHQPPASKAIASSALQIRAAAANDTGEFGQAEDALRQRLSAAPPAEKALWREQLATAMYRQGEALVAAGEDAQAGQVFLRLVDEMPVQGEAASRIRATAMYDAANAFTRAGQTELGLTLLERFRASYPQHPQAGEANRQLATGYIDSGDNHRALAELQRMLSQPGLDSATRRDATLELGRLQVETGQFAAASQTYKDIYYRGNPDAAEKVALHGRMIDLYTRSGEKDKADFWRQRTLEDERSNSTPASRTLAAESALALADDARQRYEAMEIRPPLQRSLAAKKEGFETALSAYQRAADYSIAPVATAAAYRMADVYLELHDALLRAPAPDSLSPADTLEYEQAIQARAQPFRQDAVEILEANLKRAGTVATGDPWIARSRDRLRELEPSSYTRSERLGDAVIRQP